MDFPYRIIYYTIYTTLLSLGFDIKYANKLKLLQEW